MLLDNGVRVDEKNVWKLVFPSDFIQHECYIHIVRTEAQKGQNEFLSRDTRSYKQTNIILSNEITVAVVPPARGYHITRRVIRGRGENGKPTSDRSRESEELSLCRDKTYRSPTLYRNAYLCAITMDWTMIIVIVYYINYYNKREKITFRWPFCGSVFTACVSSLGFCIINVYTCERVPYRGALKMNEIEARSDQV